MVTVAEPLLFPQVAPVVEADNEIPPVELTVVVADAVQFAEEVIVTVYVPAARFEIVAVVPPLLHAYVLAVPPPIVAVAVPVLVQPAAVDEAEAVIPVEELTTALAVALHTPAVTVTV